MRNLIAIASLMLTLISTQARAEDLDNAILQQDSEAAQIASTLRQPAAVSSSKDSKQGVTVVLIRHKKSNASENR